MSQFEKIKKINKLKIDGDGNDYFSNNGEYIDVKSINGILIDESTRFDKGLLGYNYETNKYEHMKLSVAGIVGSTGNIISPVGSPISMNAGEEVIFTHPDSYNNKRLINIQEEISSSIVSDIHVDFTNVSDYILQDNSKITVMNNKIQLKDIETISDTYWNPADKGTNVTLSNNNLTVKVTGSASQNYGVRTNKALTKGKWYWEVKVDSFTTAQTMAIGISNEIFNINTGTITNSNQLSYYGAGALVYPGATSYGSTYTTGDIIGIALDIDNKTIKFSKNGTWYANITLPTWNSYFPLLIAGGSANSTTTSINFGASNFLYNIPIGYLPFGFKVINTPIHLRTFAKSSYSLTTIDTITSLTIPVIIPTNTSIKCLFSVDNGANWLYKDGTGIHIYSGDLTIAWTNYNSNTELQTYFTNSSKTTLINDLLSLGITPISLDFCFQLISDIDSTITPNVSPITLNYTNTTHIESASFGSYDETTVKFGVKYIDNTTIGIKNLTSKTRIASVNMIIGTV